MIKQKCTLLFSKTELDENRIPHIVNVEKIVPCDNRGTFRVKYYSDQSRTMKDSVNLSVLSAYLTLGQLWRVKYNGKLYDVKNEMSDKKRGPRFTLLDCEEVKTKV